MGKMPVDLRENERNRTEEPRNGAIVGKICESRREPVFIILSFVPR